MDTENAWTQFALSPSSDTFAPLYEGTKRLVWTLCRRILSNENDADDAFQSAYLRLFTLARSSGGGAAGEDAVRLVSRIAIREADRVRKQGTRRRSRQSPLKDKDPMSHEGRVDDEASRREVSKAVERLVNALPERYRLPVQLHFFHGLSQREVARVLGEPLSTISYSIQGGLARLDPKLRKAGIGNAGAVLAGLAASAVLFEPRASAASIFAAIQAAPIAATSTVWTGVILGGITTMKLKAAVLAATLFAILLGGVVVIQRHNAGQGESPSTRTVARLEPIPSGKPQAAPEVPTSVTAPAGRSREPEQPDSPPADEITGTIVDAITKEPLAGAKVRVRGHRADAELEAVADEHGMYHLQRPGTGTQELLASAESHARAMARVEHERGASSRQDFTLEPGVTVLVLVIDDGAKPIEGASVTPPSYGTSGVYTPDFTARTGADGIARVPGVSQLQAPEILVEKEGYEHQYAHPNTHAGENEVEVECKVVLHRIALKRRAIEGRVTDASERPIAGATIEWKDGQRTSFGDGVEYGQHRATTGLDGAYLLELDDDFDTCDLGVSAKGWGPQVKQGVRFGTTEKPGRQDFTLEPSHWLSGRVVDESGHPLERVEIRAMPRKGLLNTAVAYPAVLRKVSTDSTGRFRLEDLAGPKVALALLPADSRPALDEDFEVDRDVQIALPDWGVIRGVVVDDETGAPVPSFNVKLSGVALEAGRAVQGETFTSSEGRFVLKGLEPKAAHRLIVAAAGYSTANLEGIVPVNAGEVSVRLARGELVEGVVVEATTGEPIAAAFVLWGSPDRLRDISSRDWMWQSHVLLQMGIQQTVTDVGGQFQIREASTSAIFVRAPGHERISIAPEARRRFSQKDGRLRIALARGARVHGVCYERGAPVRVQVQLERTGPGWDERREEERAHGETKTDADGRFEWDDVSAGAYVLSIGRKVEGPAPRFEVRIARWLQIAAGQDVEIELAKDLGPHRLEGRIAGLESRESLGVTVTLRSLADGNADGFVLQTYKDWGWRYACPFLKPERYAVEARFWEAGGTRTVELDPIEVTGDAERAIEIPKTR
jgi:RNA polymerase sigma factor (sigma-70 family)